MNGSQVQSEAMVPVKSSIMNRLDGKPCFQIGPFPEQEAYRYSQDNTELYKQAAAEALSVYLKEAERIRERRAQIRVLMATDSNLSEFHWAAQYNDVDILKDDIKFCQADPNKRSSIYGATALMYAAANNCIDAINYLLDLPEVDICLKDKEGYTAADHARLAGYLKLADALNQMILEETHASSVTLSSGVATPVFDSVSSSRVSPSCSADATNFF